MLRFFKNTGKTCGKIHIHRCILKVQLKKLSSKDLSNNAYVMFFADFILIALIKAYVVGTHLNCIHLWMQFKWVPTTYAFIKK